MKPTPVYTSSITTVRGVLTPEYLRSKMAPYRVPLETADQIVHYIHNGVQPGSFVRAVLENDLITAVRKGDIENRAALSRIVEYLYNTCPRGAWMSEAQVEAWLGAHRLYGEMLEATAAKESRKNSETPDEMVQSVLQGKSQQMQEFAEKNGIPVERIKLSRSSKMIEIPIDRKSQAAGERDDDDDCPECSGRGKLQTLGGDWGKTPEGEIECWKCKGTGSKLSVKELLDRTKDCK